MHFLMCCVTGPVEIDASDSSSDRVSVEEAIEAEDGFRLVGSNQEWIRSSSSIVATLSSVAPSKSIGHFTVCHASLVGNLNPLTILNQTGVRDSWLNRSCCRLALSLAFLPTILLTLLLRVPPLLSHIRNKSNAHSGMLVTFAIFLLSCSVTTAFGEIATKPAVMFSINPPFVASVTPSAHPIECPTITTC